MCREFAVHRLGQGAAPLTADEIQLLQSDQSAYEVREVILYADDKPWVFARSVIPTALTNGEWKTLGNKPLGKLLFNDQRFRRGEFEVTRIKPSALAALALDSVDFDLYGRRSLFAVHDFKVLVAEVFLPNSPVYKSFQP